MAVESASGLVGRAYERAALEDVLDRLTAGRGGVVLVAGEPGIGKTSLATAFSEWAAERGADVTWGRAWEAGGAPAFWPWIEVLREVLRDPAPFADVPGLSELSALLPEIRERLPGLAAGPAASDPQSRFRLFDAVAAVLRRASERAPLAIILDDLHAADVPSLELLRFLARGAQRSAIAVLGTYRDAEARLSEPAGAALARIEREARVLHPGRLRREEIAELATRATGRAATDELVTRLAGVTEGNPLFVVETLRLLRDQGDGGGARSLPVAGGVREVIRDRLAVLPDDAREVVVAASVLGREIDPELLSAAAGRVAADLEAAIEIAIAADVLTRRDDGRLAFSHILLREVPYRAMPAERRAKLHAAVAEALAARVAAGADASLAELAHHAFEAAPVAGLERAIEWASQAAQHAMAVRAFEDAASLLERAVAAMPATGDDARRFDLVLALGEARIRSGLDRKGREACLEAVEIARRLDDADKLVRATLMYGEVLTFAAHDMTLIALLEETLAALGGQDRPETARLLARLAAALQPARDPHQPMELARDAIAMARRVGKDPCRLAVLHSAVSALLYFGDPEERASLSTEQVALARSLGDRIREARAHMRLVFDRIEVGDLARADASILEYERVSRELRLPAVAWWGPMLRAMRAVLEGRFAEAEEREAEAQVIAAQADDSNTTLTTTAFRLGLYWTAARHEQLLAFEPTARAVLERGIDRYYVTSLLAGMQARMGRTAEARAELARIAPDIDIFAFRPMSAWVGEAAVLTGDRAIAQRVFDALAGFEHRLHVWGNVTMVCDAPITMYRGMVAGFLQKDAETDRLFADAAARTDAMNARPAGARARYEWARALVRRGDSTRAAPLIDDARRTADELDMPALRTSLEALLAPQPPSRPSVPPPAPAPAITQPLPAELTFSLVLEGEVWTVTCGDKTFRLKDSKGLQMLAQLVAHPGRELHVTDLVAPGGEAGHVEDAGEVLDREAVAQYRQRSKDLQEELREAEEWGDAGRVERVREELEFLAAELSRGLGIGGRSRKAASSAEKARVNVQRRLKDAIQRIAEQHAALGQHLERAVKTGTFCSYR